MISEYNSHSPEQFTCQNKELCSPMFILRTGCTLGDMVMKRIYLLIHLHSTTCVCLVNVSIETEEWLLRQGYLGISLWILFLPLSNQHSWVWLAVSGQTFNWSCMNSRGMKLKVNLQHIAFKSSDRMRGALDTCCADTKSEKVSITHYSVKLIL